MMMETLTGITWDHVRGYGPLDEASNIFQQQTGMNVKWDRRSLKDFGDYPIHLLSEKYDLIMLDHPFVGEAYQHAALLPLDEWISSNFLNEQRENSVGLSYQSYSWEGKQWALAVDATAQVSAFRKDLLESVGCKVPATWDELFTLFEELPHNISIAMPLAPTDCICSLLTLCSNITHSYDFFSQETGLNKEVVSEALYVFKRLITKIHPDSFLMNPIKMLDHMSQRDDIAYVPLTFGYSNYSRENYSLHKIYFSNIPSSNLLPSGSVLGGVGLGVSAYSKHKDKASQFVELVASGEFQRTIYFTSGGQPGHRNAWIDGRVNFKSNDFFRNTLQTLDLSYLRPRFANYNAFQERVGNYLHDALRNNNEVGEIVTNIQRIYNWLNNK